MKSPRLIYVEWLDATTDIGWDEKLTLQAHLIKSVGWLMQENKDQILIAADLSPPETNRRLAIPLGWIKNKRFL